MKQLSNSLLYSQKKEFKKLQYKLDLTNPVVLPETLGGPTRFEQIVPVLPSIQILPPLGCHLTANDFNSSKYSLEVASFIPDDSQLFLAPL